MTTESKHERFRRLAQSRGDRLIREVALLANLANTKNYSYSADDVEALFRPIEAELAECRARFTPGAASQRKVSFE